MNKLHKFLLGEGFRIFSCKPYKPKVDITNEPTSHYFSTMGNISFEYHKEGYPVIISYLTFPSGCDIILEFNDKELFYPFKFYIYDSFYNVLHKTDIRFLNKPLDLAMQQMDIEVLFNLIINKQFICFDYKDKLVSKEYYNSLPKIIKLEKYV